MNQNTLEFLEAYQSDMPSTFTEDVKWRQENEVWLKWSRGVAMSIVDYMQENGLSRFEFVAGIMNNEDNAERYELVYTKS